MEKTYKIIEFLSGTDEAVCLKEYSLPYEDAVAEAKRLNDFYDGEKDFVVWEEN